MSRTLALVEIWESLNGKVCLAFSASSGKEVSTLKTVLLTHVQLGTSWSLEQRVRFALPQGHAFVLQDLPECPLIIIIIIVIIVIIIISHLAQILIPSGCRSLCKEIGYTACTLIRWACSFPHLRPCLACFCGDYEELLTDIQDYGKLQRARETRLALTKPPGVARWILGFSEHLGRYVNWCMFKWVSLTINVQTLRREGRLLEICRALRSSHFIGLQSTSDRTEPEEDSPVYTTKADKFRVYRFPWRQGSLFPSKHSRVAIAIRENTFLPANVRRIYTPPAQLAGRGGALKLVRGDAAFLIMTFFLPPSPSNLREKQRSEKIWKWARKVLDETPSRVVPVLLLDANGHISHTPWPEQIGKYSSKKTTFNGQ